MAIIRSQCLSQLCPWHVKRCISVQCTQNDKGVSRNLEFPQTKQEIAMSSILNRNFDFGSYFPSP